MPLRRIIPGLLLLVVIVGTTALLLRPPPAPQPLQPTFGPVDQGDNPLVEKRQFMFTSNRDGDWDIYVMALADGSITNLTNNDADDGFASYSADGGAITFLSNRNGKLDPFMMNADGSDPRALANDLPTIISVVTSGRLDWDFTDGLSSRSAFVSLRDLNLEVYARENGADRNLTHNGAVDWFPDWSSDSRIAFDSDRDGNQEIYVMNAGIDDAGSSPRRLTNAPGDDLYPMWWGNQIVFMSDRDLPFAKGKIGLYILNLDDANPQAQPLDRNAQIFDLGWQRRPEDDSVLSMRLIDGQWDIFLSDTTGRHGINETNSRADDLFPVWRPIP